MSKTQRTALRVCWSVAAVLMAVLALQFGTGLAGHEVTAFFQDTLYNGLLLAGAGFCLWRAVAIREERLAWVVLGCGIVTWTAADVVWTVAYANDPGAPYPSWADLLWVTYYPAACITLILLVRSRAAGAAGASGSTA